MKNLTFLFLFSFLFPFFANAQMFLTYRNQKVTDGDTFRVEISQVSQKRKVYYDWVNWPIRVFSVDTWETRGRGKRKQTPEQNKLAKAATDSLNQWILKEDFLLQYLGKDNSGKRLVCVIHFEDGTTLKDRLKKYGLASGKHEDYIFQDGRISKRKKQRLLKK